MINFIAKKQKKSIYDIFDEEESFKIEKKILTSIPNDNAKHYGRTRNKDQKKELCPNSGHNKYTEDNKRNKIMNNFLKFLISFLNENLKENEFTQFLFLKLKKIRKVKTLNSSSIKQIFNSTIFEFCENQVSIRNKKKRSEVVHLNPTNIINLSKNIYELKVCDFYHKYFLSNRLNEEETIFDYYFGKSNELLNFHHFLNKFKEEENYQKALIKTANNLINFINNFNSNNTQNSTVDTKDLNLMTFEEEKNDDILSFHIFDDDNN